MPVFCVSRISHAFLYLICMKNRDSLRVKPGVNRIEVDVGYF